MLVRRMSSRLSSPFGRRSTEPHPAQAAERATRAAARDAERAAEEQFSIGAPHTLANYVTPALVLHERVRQPVLVSASYGHGDRASDLFTLLGNGGRRYLREMSVFMSALQSNGFVLERAHLVTFHSWWVVTGRFMRYYLAVADKVWGGWLDAAVDREKTRPPSNSDGNVGVGVAVIGLRDALARLTATWASFATAPDAAAVMPILWRDCHALSAAASVAFLAVEATLPAEVAAAPRGAKREAEARAVAMARRVFGDDVGLVILCHWLPAAWAARLARKYLRDPADRQAWETTRRDYEAHSRHTLRFFEANQGRPTALGPADRPLRDPARLAIEPAPGGAPLAIEAPPQVTAV